jgi:hypothetical protein
MLGGKNYYALIAGLREFTLDGAGKDFDAPAIVSEIREALGRSDVRVLELFYGWYDILNVVNMRAGRSQFNALGNFTQKELEAELAEPENLPEWMSRVVGAYNDPENTDYEDVDTSFRFERALFEAYYTECAKAKSSFLRAWSRFDRNLRNVIAAYTARGKQVPVVDALVGSDDITLSLTRSSAADFGLKGELEYIDNLLSTLSDEGNIVEKERTIDIIRWNKADELAEIDYFNMNAILSYLVKVNLIHRWMALDVQTGRAMYDRLVASMSATEKIKTNK